MYGRGVLVRKYQRGQPIKVRVELTANHMGYFEFRICPNNNPAQVASQKCLDTNVLQKTSGGGPRYNYTAQKYNCCAEVFGIIAAAQRII